MVDGEKPGVDSRYEGETYGKERSVIRREDDVDGRASVKTARNINVLSIY